MGGSLTYEELIKAIGSGNKPKYFVETGTYRAETTMNMAPYFQAVYTTEIDEGLYKDNISKFGGIVTNVNFMLGDSIKLLPEITEKVRDGAIFFLDAHISGADSSWNGKNRVPIYEELDSILETGILGPSIFIIDDVRLWKGKTWDWAHINNIDIVLRLKKAGLHIQAFYEANDRFYILTRNY